VADEPRPRIRSAAITDIAAMHKVRLAVRENRLSRPDRVTPGDYEARIRTSARAFVCEVPEAVWDAVETTAARETMRRVIVGFAIVDAADRNVWALFVDPAHEHRGIGRALHDRALAWLASQVTGTAWLTTGPGTRAAGFYAAAGWREVGVTADGELRFEREL
jgi:GNAT superfamily N-acetyltransferase